MRIEDIKELVLSACKKYNVKRLDVFGSSARGDEKNPRDLDFLVEFHKPDYLPSKRFFGLLHYLEDTTDCPIDLVSINGVRNPFFLNRIMKERKNVYEG